jgi:hypothetical protein
MKELLPHPNRAADARSWTLQAEARRDETDVLELGFRVGGEIARIVVPTSAEPRFSNGLWRHTCFEAFIGIAGAPAYHELNLAPSGQWAVYAFDDYRYAAASPRSYETPRVACTATPRALELRARLRLGDLSPQHAHCALDIALCAVLEVDAGEISHWALRHDGEVPDFHDRRGFAVRLEARPSA